MRKQYHFWPAGDGSGFDAWDVNRLIELSRELPVEVVPLDSIGEIDTPYWFDGSDESPTVRKVVEHTALILEADLTYPIILGHDGRVMDGMHRVNGQVDALAGGQESPHPSLSQTDGSAVLPPFWRASFMR